MPHQKPNKPYPDFPLFAHATRRWAKKIKGKLHYFGPWDDPQAALRKYLDQRDDLQAGRMPRLTPGDTSGLTVKDLLNRFMAAKEALVKSNELTERAFYDYHQIGKLLIAGLGRDRLVTDLRAADFTVLRGRLANEVAATTLGNRIRLTLTIFKWAYDADLIDQPVKLGPEFKPPSKKVMRAAKQAQPLRLFKSSELKLLLERATPAMKAMILLGVNCGFGNTDCALVEKAKIDWKRGWVNFPRPKTAIPRRCPLWPETMAAMKAAALIRPSAKSPEDADRLFLTRCGVRFARTSATGKPIDSLSSEFVKLTAAVGIRRQNLTFYALRHTTETIGGAMKDQPAMDLIMGHVSEGMSAGYREKIDDDRLLAISNHIRTWLFGATGATEKAESPA